MNEITKISSKVADGKSQSEIQNNIVKIIEELASGIKRINQKAEDVGTSLKSVEGKGGLFGGGNKENINVLRNSLSITQDSMRWITELISKNTELNLLAIASCRDSLRGSERGISKKQYFNRRSV